MIFDESTGVSAARRPTLLARRLAPSPSGRPNVLVVTHSRRSPPWRAHTRRVEKRQTEIRIDLHRHPLGRSGPHRRNRAMLLTAIKKSPDAARAAARALMPKANPRSPCPQYSRRQACKSCPPSQTLISIPNDAPTTAGPHAGASSMRQQNSQFKPGPCAAQSPRHTCI